MILHIKILVSRSKVNVYMSEKHDKQNNEERKNLLHEEMNKLEQSIINIGMVRWTNNGYMDQ